MDGADRVRAADHVDVLATVQDREKKQRVTVTLLQNITVLRRMKSGQVATQVFPEESELLALAARIAPLYVVRRQPKDLSVDEKRGQTSYDDLWLIPRQKGDFRTRLSRFQKGLGQPASRRTASGLVRGAREICLPLAGADGVMAGDHLDILATIPSRTPPDWVSFTLLTDVVVSDQPRAQGCVPVLLIPRECERAVMALRLGTLSASLRNPNDPPVLNKTCPMTRSVIITGERRGCIVPEPRYNTIGRIKKIMSLPAFRRATPSKPPRPVMRSPRPSRPAH